ncbi:DEHA2A14652p [Debaryomyces hansenii CBS767]|uniref:DEHA2A14652p n=1 Tax=Debaryomyces hansenii (strain ATCC 36239 / CBS 767 / BCRC 21394 / JCM 1990 / NBRC 0083 / IGC 2968) TaxID=284592 RepID=Q6BXV7_DEBHA|nr:DEHA2A14652p [Debaryomyces hansenii CBS767]CAG84941.2 DEHA2A14652p [Debaryomyces hansenii CBS767]|eukprot:XP_456962.2 DEHA2A14652p [Debaryomyces hansenii CBS767]
MEVIESVVRDTEELTNRYVLAVYLRGSRIRGLNDDESDYDITVLTNPTKRELLTNVMFSEKLRLPQYNVEGNITTSAHFYKLLLRISCSIGDNSRIPLIYRQKLPDLSCLII